MMFLQKLFRTVKGDESEEEKNIIILDTSALNCDKAMTIIDKADKVILLTGIIREMDNYKLRRDKFGDHIRKVSLLSRKDEKSEKFVCISKYNSCSYQDDNILWYCRKHKGVKILTRDNNLCNLAKAFGIPYIYVEDEPISKPSNDMQKCKKNNNSFKPNIQKQQQNHGIYLVSNEIHLVPNNNCDSEIKLVRNNQLMDSKDYQVGDHIFLFRYYKKKRYLKLQEYEIVKEAEKATVNLIDEAKVYCMNEIYTLGILEELQEAARLIFLEYTNY